MHSWRPAPTGAVAGLVFTWPCSKARNMATIVLSSPASLVASLPYLVGFHPHDSVVLIWLRAGEILLTQRANAPQQTREDWLAALWQHPSAALADEVIILGVSSMSGIADIVASVSGYARERGPRVRDALVVQDSTWCSVLCEDPACCCSTPRRVPIEVTNAVAAEFAFRGVAPAACRQDLEAEVAAEGHRQVTAVRSRLTRRGTQRPASLRAIERWRDRVIDEALSWCESGQPRREGAYARVIAGVQDVRVRDVILWELARMSDERLRAGLSHWHRATRMSPADHVAPVATMAAIASWLLGDGARAIIAVGRAREADPTYGLAQLVDAALSSGLPPRLWREGTHRVTREVCRHGSAATGPGGVVARPADRDL